MDMLDRVAMNNVEFWFSGKNKLIETLMDKTGKKGLILNNGCGDGSDIEVLKKYGNVISTDINIEAVNFIGMQNQRIISDSVAMPFTSEKFDFVVMFDVLEHIEDDMSVIKEVHRILKNDGYFVIIVPAFNFLYSSHDRILKHFRRYGSNEIIEKLRSFSINETGYWNFFLFLFIAFVRLIKKDSRTNIHIFNIPHTILWIFGRILMLENMLIKKGFRLPFGLSIYCIAKKTI